MKILLITNSNKSSGQFIIQKLEQAWQQMQQMDLRKTRIPLSLDTKDQNLWVIDNMANFENFDFRKTPPDVVFIVPELMWSHKGVNEGYEVARTLLTEKLQHNTFQLVFLSVLEKADLLKHASSKHHGLIQAFPHYCLLESILLLKFNHYSTIHFELLKSLAVSDDGRRQMIQHDFDGIISDWRRKPLDEVRAKLSRLLVDFSVFDLWTDNESVNLRQLLEAAESQDTVALVVKKLREILEHLKSVLDADVQQEITTTANYKVLIVEDDEFFREQLMITFGELFKTVQAVVDHTMNETTTASASIRNSDVIVVDDIAKYLRGKAGDFQVIILDLLYKDGSGQWLPFNGLDLYRICREVNPYASIRIITSLPREVVSRIIERTLQLKIPVSHVFTKKVGVDALRHNIRDRAVEIILECKEHERRRSMFKPYPRNGIFGWPGIPGLLNKWIIEEAEEFQTHVKESLGFFDMFQKGTLNATTHGWGKGELPSEKQKDSITEMYFSKKIRSVLTHRMIVLHEAYKNETWSVLTDDYINNILTRISNQKTAEKSYFLTKLGFSVKEFGQLKEDKGFIISRGNLFMHELAYFSQQLIQHATAEILKDKWTGLFQWFKEVMKELQTYEDWDELDLDYCPYKKTNQIDKTGVISDDDIDWNVLNKLNLQQLTDFLMSLIKKYTAVENLCNMVMMDKAISKSTKVPAGIQLLLDQLYATEPEELSGE